MAVTTTAADIILAGRVTSIRNRASLATDATEMFDKVNRALRGLYAAAARINPDFFAESAIVTLAGAGWARPEAAESVSRIERNAQTTGGSGAAGTKVEIVTLHDREAELGKPAVYPFGKVYRSAGNPKDPTGGNLVFYYSRRPTDPATENDPLDSQWEENFNELLIVETALYLAGKDARGDDITKLVQDRLEWLRLYIAFLQHETADVRIRYQQHRIVSVNELLPMLAPAGA